MFEGEYSLILDFSMYFLITICANFAWLSLYAKSKLRQFAVDPFYDDFPVNQFRFQNAKRIKKPLVLLCSVIEGQNVDINKKIVTAKRIFDLHKQTADSIVAWAKRQARRPVIQQKFNGFIQGFFIIQKV